MKKYSIGIDYGTLSARALLVDLENGRECATAVYEFPHAVMAETFLDGTPLPADFALEHPADYIEALENVIPAVLRDAGARDPRRHRERERQRDRGDDRDRLFELPVFPHELLLSPLA